MPSTAADTNMLFAVCASALAHHQVGLHHDYICEASTCRQFLQEYLARIYLPSSSWSITIFLTRLGSVIAWDSLACNGKQANGSYLCHLNSLTWCQSTPQSATPSLATTSTFYIGPTLQYFKWMAKEIHKVSWNTTGQFNIENGLGDVFHLRRY